MDEIEPKDSYSELYKAIRKEAETEWDNWRREYYNDVFAVSAHAIKIPIKEEQKDVCQRAEKEDC